MKILIVDDEQSILQVVRDFLADCDYGVVTAGDGAAAISVLEQRSDIDLIVTDIRMPRMDGLALLKAARVRYPGIPVILMTGHGDEQVAIEALHEGAQDYLKKPLQFREFLTCIEQVEERKRLEAQVVRDYQSLTRREREGADGVVGEERDFGQQATILLVDDDSNVRAAVRRSLREHGHMVQTATTQAEGLRKFAEGLFDVVIGSADLTDADGIEMIRQMRAVDPTVAPIVLTLREDREVVIRALESGARGLVQKPIDAIEMLAAVDSALAERKRMVDVRLLLGDLLQVRSELRQKVVERERYLEHLIDATPFAVVSTDTQDAILTFNNHAEEMYGYTNQEIVGFEIGKLIADSEADPRMRTDHGSGAAKSIHRNKAGGDVPVLVRRQDIVDDRNLHIASLYVIEELTGVKHLSGLATIVSPVLLMVFVPLR